MAVVTLPIDDTSLGQSIAANGTLNSLTLNAVPTYYYSEGFTLVDIDASGVETTVFHIYIPTSFVSAGSVLMSNAGIHFKDLTVKNIEPGTKITMGWDNGL